MRVAKAVFATVLGLGLAGTARATVVNLTTQNSFGSLNGGIFVQGATHPTGTGVFNPFLKLGPGGNLAGDQGYNTSGRFQGSPKTQYDENNSLQHYP